VKRAILCLLLLSGCPSSEQAPLVREYTLTWTCLSPEGCERTEEVARIDRAERAGTDYQFTSTLDETFAADAKRVASDLLPPHCSWMYFLSLFGHELERSQICFGPAIFELELSIPNADPTTSSMWLVEGRGVNLL
jgi:hypothetical protein